MLNIRYVKNRYSISGTLHVECTLQNITGAPFRFVIIYLDAKQDKRQVISDAKARYFGTVINDHSLVPADGARRGRIEYQSSLRIPGNLR